MQYNARKKKILLTKLVTRLNKVKKPFYKRSLRSSKTSELEKPAKYNYSINKTTRLQHENSANRIAYGAHNFNR